MSALVPRHRMSHVAAWLAAEGHDLLTAPASLVAIALAEPSGGIDDSDLAGGRQHLRQGPSDDRVALLMI